MLEGGLDPLDLQQVISDQVHISKSLLVLLSPLDELPNFILRFQVAHYEVLLADPHDDGFPSLMGLDLLHRR